jgi:hypothetical protein
MTNAADLIQLLLRRTQLRAHRMPPPGEFPAGWKQWFAAMKLHPGHVTGAPADQIVGELARRAPSMPPVRVADLTRWQAFSTLWRQEWQPAEPVDRRIRVAAGAISVLWHVLFVVLLVWLMYLQYLVATPPPQGEDVVQVEYIGAGMPENSGGGEPAPAPAPVGEAPSPRPPIEPARSAPQPPAPNVAVEVPELEAPLPDIPQRDVPEPVVPPIVVEQAVTVSEPTPSTEPDAFLLPPPQPRIADVPMAAPDLQAPSRELQVMDVPAPVQPIQLELPQPTVTARPIEARTPEIVVRDVPAPLPQLPMREIAVPAIEQPQLSASTPQVRERAVPAPSQPAASPPADTATAANPAASSAGLPSQSDASSASAASAASVPPGQSNNGLAATAAGTGPKLAPVPGGWPSPDRSDDWGDSNRNVPGAQRGDPSGVFDSDGSVRLAETPGSASPGQPPGTVTQEIADLDRAGTWLKREPTGYEPTAFDRYWLPHETLLAEWVRKGIKEVAIPIPGTSKNIVCVVSLLQLGGGCGVSDPNLSEQPASARPPPDIPFKPHLQEDNGSVRPAR